MYRLWIRIYTDYTMTFGVIKGAEGKIEEVFAGMNEKSAAHGPRI
jgi:hypothetical protein